MRQFPWDAMSLLRQCIPNPTCRIANALVSAGGERLPFGVPSSDEILHETVRPLFIVPAVGDFRSRQVGVFTGSLLLVSIAYCLLGTPRRVGS
jgi:hypothetical protein